MNKVIMMGRLTKDPDIRATASGVSVASFTLAVNRRFAKKDAEATADFFNIIAWQNQAEFARNYLKKGLQIVVVGRLQNRSWEGQDGVKRYATDVIAEEIYFADSKKKEEEPDWEQVDTGELPF